MSTQTTQLICNPLAVPDAVLREVRSMSLGEPLNRAPRFAEWLHTWADEEQAARGRRSLERREVHALCFPHDAIEWTDREIGASLIVCLESILQNYSAPAVELFANWSMLFATLAAERLGWTP